MTLTDIIADTVPGTGFSMSAISNAVRRVRKGDFEGLRFDCGSSLEPQAVENYMNATFPGVAFQTTLRIGWHPPA